MFGPTDSEINVLLQNMAAVVVAVAAAHLIYLTLRL